ncbi:hypothetical protein SAMN05216537_11913 [Lachnospira multipara]|uniref:Uncharacterized protein n=2 Tax=Lachnospira multipara TaxID=28051 RepID=A0A1H5WVZ5_9FIRM|nr:hypothetical protein SAMN05216537_11913 [Lachnospira multipara]
MNLALIIKIVFSIMFLLAAVIGTVGTKLLERKIKDKEEKDELADTEFIDTSIDNEEENQILDELASNLLSSGYEDDEPEDNDEYIDYVDDIDE